MSAGYSSSLFLIPSCPPMGRRCRPEGSVCCYDVQPERASDQAARPSPPSSAARRASHAQRRSCACCRLRVVLRCQHAAPCRAGALRSSIREKRSREKRRRRHEFRGDGPDGGMEVDRLAEATSSGLAGGTWWQAGRRVRQNGEGIQACRAAEAGRAKHGPPAPPSKEPLPPPSHGSCLLLCYLPASAP